MFFKIYLNRFYLLMVMYI